MSRNKHMGQAVAVAVPFLAALFVGLGCREDSSPSNADVPIQSASVGVEGGTLSVEGATLRIPPGALASETVVTLRLTSEEPQGSFDRHSPVYRFEPDGKEFLQPVEVSITFSGTPIRPELWWSLPEGGFAPVGGANDGQQVVATVTHFSAGFVGSAAGASDSDTIDHRDVSSPMDAAGPFSGPLGGIPEELARACVFFYTCGARPFGSGGQCIETLSLYRMDPGHVGGLTAQLAERALACGGAAATCRDLLDCMRMDTEACGGGRFVCQGDLRVLCAGDQSAVVHDCAALGLSCADGECVAGVGAACDYESIGGSTICDGDHRLLCTPPSDREESWILKDVCSEGWTCHQAGDEISGAESACIPRESCDAESLPTCEGDVLVHCRHAPGGSSLHPLREFRWDCAAAGQICEGSAEGGRCAPAERGSDCVEDDSRTCTNGGVDLRLCLQGHEITVRCADYGRSACQPPADRAGQARCAIDM